MPNYTVKVPSPQPTVHKIEFTMNELIEALTDYAAKHDIVILEGMTNIWGLETKNMMTEQVITLVVTVED